MENNCVPNLNLLSDEELFKKHRQERRELQARIQSMKKSIPKGDKKKRKEVNELAIKLEKELDAKQNEELVVEKPSESEIPEIVNCNEHAVEDANVRTSRAQKRREKKELEEREREKRIHEQLEVNKDGPRNQEIKDIKETLKSHGLELYNIPADGNCLYCAVNHQLQLNQNESYSIQKLRLLTSDFIRENKEEFIPFMYNDSEEPVNEDQFEEYCKEVATTKLWGGQLELKALSQILKCPIKVIQASGPPTLQGENFDGPELVLTYHRHLYKLGEHYNSTIPVSENGNDSDSNFQ